MATNGIGNQGTNQRCRTWYAMLLRLYPRTFRARFGEGMAQTFHDLCLAHMQARRGLFGLALWVFSETFVGIVREHAIHMTPMRKTILRVALAALAMLMVPLVASQIVEGWNWPPGTFVFAYLMFFGTGLAYALIARKMGAWAYKGGVGLALVVGFVTGWTNMVHMSESENPANLVYFGVLVVGGVGAWLARLEARGMARAMFTMAATLAVITGLDLALSSNPPSWPAQSIAVGHLVFAALFAASGLLFRHASLAGLKSNPGL